MNNKKETFLDDLIQQITLNDILNKISNASNKREYTMFQLLKAYKLESTNKKNSEVLAVIPDNVLRFEGFKKYSKRLSSSLEYNLEYFPRSYVEYNTLYRQLVCEAIIVNKTQKSNMYGFLKRNDRKLKCEYSLVGGHMNSTDTCLFGCLIREQTEELAHISFEDSKICPLGFIRLDKPEISKQHLGVIYVIETPSVQITAREEGNSFIWLPEKEVKKYLGMSILDSPFDSWTHIGLTEYFNNIHKKSYR